jgi:DNA-binding PadR family transcriptional regulator
MQEHRSSDVTPHEAVLCVIAQRPGTVAEIRARLGREFPYANYPPNTAGTALPRLARKHAVRLVRSGEESAEDFYEITERGLADLERWLYDLISIPLPLRDPLQARLLHVPPRGVPRLTGIVKILAEASAEKYGAEQAKVKALTFVADSTGSAEAELRLIMHQYTANLWALKTQVLTKLNRALEEFQATHDDPQGVP